MKKIYFILSLLPSLSFAQLATPNGQTQATLNSNTGNIGIGTNDPREKLDLNGNLRVNNGSDHSFIRLGNKQNNNFISDSSPNKYYGGGYFFRVHNDNVPHQYIDALMLADNGNVGIGSHNPTERLDVNGNLRVNNGGPHSSIILGTKNNNAIITDGTGNKFYGGGYFFRVHNDNVPHQYIDALMLADNGNAALHGKFEAKEIKVTESPTADFVFEEDYKLPTLKEVEKHIRENKHLPEIASAKQMEKEGVNVGEFQIQLLQKIEELTLYIIEQNKRIEKLEKNKTK